MTSRHSTYKKKSRWDKADPLAKTNSTYQRKITHLLNELNRTKQIAKARKIILNKHGELLKKLVDENKVSKEYLVPYLPRYTDVMKKLKISER
jgi:hypothetical protein